MTMHNSNMIGMPYFPGVAVGKLHRGKDGDIEKRIVLITQDEITAFATLPAGFVVVEAAPLSHTMIALLGFGVPTVLISKQQATRLQEGVQLLIDGNSGRITDQLESVPPVVEYQPGNLAGQAVLMADGEPVNLRASVRRSFYCRRMIVYRTLRFTNVLFATYVRPPYRYR